MDLARKLVLGFCLGAQLIGAALGAPAEKSLEKEIGLYPVELTTEGMADSLLYDFPQNFHVLHWHGEMPGLTQEALVLAKSAGCSRQIVKYRKGLYGFQCHLEITREGIEALINACPEDLQPGKFIQSKEDLLKQASYQSIHEKAYLILDRLVACSLRFSSAKCG